MAYQPNNSIEKLEKKIDSRMRPHSYSDNRTEFERSEINVGDTWQTESISDLVQKTREEKEHNQSKFFKRILFSSIGFFVLAVVVALYIFFVGANTVSSNNIDIVVSGPTSIAGGNELVLDVIIQNKNSTDLDGVTLSMEYPEGTRVAGDISKELIHQRESIGVVPARGEIRRTMKSVLFGEKETIKTIKITMEYRVQGSSALFSKEKKYDIGISSAPIIVTPEYPSVIKANESFSFKLDISSNTSELLQNVLIQAEYPFGFIFESSDPKPVSSNNVWRLGDLSSGDKRDITINGVLQGQDMDERTFRFFSGIAGQKDNLAIGANLTSSVETVKVQKSELALELNVGGKKNSDYIAGLGERIPVIVNLANNLPTNLINAQVKVKITGGIFDKNSVISNRGGFYRSSDNTITWDKNTNPELAQISPGKSSSYNFTISTLKSLSQNSSNESMTIEASFEGSQLSPNNIPIFVKTETSQQVKLGSVLGFANKAVRSIGPFENFGPIPPKAEQDTTYTIIWTLTNSVNDSNNVIVKATLPAYVKWNDLTSPSTEKISYDSLNRTVTWNAGTVKGGTGFSSTAREVAFNIVLTPSLGQVNTSPVLINSTTVTGTDAFTGKAIDISRIELNTKTTGDPNYKSYEDIVVR